MAEKFEVVILGEITEYRHHDTGVLVALDYGGRQLSLTADVAVLTDDDLLELLDFAGYGG